MFCKKDNVWIFLLVSLHIGSSLVESEDTEDLNKTQAGITPDVKPRFFDLGGVMNQLFSGSNQGGAAGGIPGLNLPSNSQFYPGVPARNKNPQATFNQENGWYPNQQNVQRPNFQNQRLPTESNFNQQGSINNINQPGQYLNQGGVGQYPAGLNGNLINGNQFGQDGNLQYSNAQQGQPQLGVNQGQGVSNYDQNNSFLNQIGQSAQGGNIPSTNGQSFGNGFNNPQDQTFPQGQGQNLAEQNSNGRQTQNPSQNDYSNGGTGFSNGQSQALPRDQNIAIQNGQYLQNGLNNDNNKGLINDGKINANNQNPGQWNNNGMPPNQGQNIGLQNQNQNGQNFGNDFNNPASRGNALNQGQQGTTLNGIRQTITNPSQLNTNVADEGRSNQNLNQQIPQLSSGDSWKQSPSGSNRNPMGEGNSNSRGPQTDAIKFPGEDEESDEDDDGEDDEMYVKTKRESLMSGTRIPSMPISDQISFTDSAIITASQKQCVQSCPTSTEYKPVCGTDEVSYFNAEKLICARNCGIRVFEAYPGSCMKSN